MLVRKGELAEAHRNYVRGAEMYRDILAKNPTLDKDPRAGDRYNAACAATLAAATAEADALSEGDRAAWREQARHWLSLNLSAWKDLAAQSPPPSEFDLVRALSHWFEDPDLASVRDADALAQLPPAERDAWQQLWTDVRQLLATAQQTAAAEQGPPPPPAAEPQQ